MALAKRFYKIMIISTLVVGLSIAVCLLTFKYQIAKMFTLDETIVEMFAAGVQVIAFFFVFASMTYLFNGTARAMGLQFYTAIWAIPAYWCIGVPQSYYLGININWGVVGLALGM